MQLVSYAFVGVEPEVMGFGPVPATEKALSKAGLTIDDIGLFELNEAFAVQVLAFLDHYGIADDDPRVNPYGGAIALGHPLASPRRAADDPAGPAVRRAPRRPLRPHHHVRRPRHGRHGHLGEPGLRTGVKRLTSTDRREQVAIASDEVVTQAPVRYVDLPAAGDVALITLDNGQDHTKPNTFGPQGLAELNAALDAVAAREPTVVAIGVTGKPFIFAVGADLNGVAEADRPRAGARARPARPPACSAGSRTRRCRPSRSSTARRMGGGLEIALHCTYRTISVRLPALSHCPSASSAWSRAGAARYLLPNLIGADGAVKVVVENALTRTRCSAAPRRSSSASPTRCFELGRLPRAVAARGLR